ncbi:arad-like aldolase/epimerase [Tothia fuscella]|uniref:Arad-like aldolase/epimerase n=1 Tax=Tothia fuscella TaxID=1048955 RepID=A0A9P4NVV0_9PEZI|nr:arad-like aldolase/epimerase [Tothia fuscella]
MVNLTELYRIIVTANHILHNQDVVDAFGHISVRHPTKPDVYILSANMAPSLVSRPSDLVEYYVANSSAVDPNAPKGFIERYIHSEMYKKYSNISCVIHSHAETVLSFAVSGVPLRPVYHMAGFMGTTVPVHDSQDYYGPTSKHDMLISSIPLGASLADTFTNTNSTATNSTTPQNTVVLMRRHGFTTWGPDIKTAVYRAVFMKTDAGVQANAINLREALDGVGGTNMGETEFELASLTEEQARDCKKMNEEVQDRPWDMWVRNVERSPLYDNFA